MFNFLLCCIKKKQNIQPLRKNANEQPEIKYKTPERDKEIKCNKNIFNCNKKNYKIKLDKNGKGLLKEKDELHKLFLDKRKNRKKLNTFREYNKNNNSIKETIHSQNGNSICYRKIKRL
jgi:hypothetical protein